MGFTNRENVRVKFMNRSEESLAVLETVLDPRTLEAIEAALFPPASEDEKAVAYQKAIDLLEVGGVDKADPVLVALKDALNVKEELTEGKGAE